METGGEEQVQSRGGEKRDRQKEMERERWRGGERERGRERESLCCESASTENKATVRSCLRWSKIPF